MDKRVYFELRTEIFDRLSTISNLHIKQLSVKDKLEIADLVVDAVAERDAIDNVSYLSWRLVIAILVLTISGTSLVTYFLLT